MQLDEFVVDDLIEPVVDHGIDRDLLRVSPSVGMRSTTGHGDMPAFSSWSNKDIESGEEERDYSSLPVTGFGMNRMSSIDDAVYLHRQLIPPR